MDRNELDQAQAGPDIHAVPGLVELLGSGDSHPERDAHSQAAAPDPTPWLTLRIAVEAHEAAMEYRKAFDNRARAWGESNVTAIARDSIHLHEGKLRLNATHAYRQCVPTPIREWQAATPGLGEPGVARLLGHVGHPAWKWVHQWHGEGKCKNPDDPACDCPGRHLVLVDSSPRTFGQLIAYSGIVPGRGKRSKGMSVTEIGAFGNDHVGPVLHSLAEAAGVKIAGPFRALYDEEKARYERDRPEWGPKPGHWHNAALRRVKREILRGLWTAAQQ